MKNYVIKECRFDLQDIYADRLDCEYKKIIEGIVSEFLNDIKENFAKQLTDELKRFVHVEYEQYVECGFKTEKLFFKYDVKIGMDIVEPMKIMIDNAVIDVKPIIKKENQI
jgi:hypothetical protein